MTMHTVPKTIFNRSLKLARTPFDVALGVTGASDSSAKRALDRIEAGVRSATGTVFRDEELARQGRKASLATDQRERAAELRAEAELREQEAAHRAAQAAKRTAEAEAKAKRKAAKVKRANTKRDKAAQLEKLEAKEASLATKESALLAQREAERVKGAASAAKQVRKNGDTGGG
jgi:hypothetical protein